MLSLASNRKHKARPAFFKSKESISIAEASASSYTSIYTLSFTLIYAKLTPVACTKCESKLINLLFKTRSFMFPMKKRFSKFSSIICILGCRLPSSSSVSRSNSSAGFSICKLSRVSVWRSWSITICMLYLVDRICRPKAIGEERKDRNWCLLISMH